MENKQTDILIILEEKIRLENKLHSLTYGSIEIRHNQANQYIYVHYREDGILLTKYVGEYSDQLHQEILKNNLESKELKKRLKQIYKQLKALQYFDVTLSSLVEQNIDFARKNLVDSIYKQSILEGVATTYMDTETIIEGGKVQNMSPDDILKIVNLHHAWNFILNKHVISTPSSFMLLCEINRFIEEGFYYSAGRIRNVPVSIGGTNWKPSIPLESVVKEELMALFTSDIAVIDLAIEVLLYIMKKQIFIDGNKRTAIVFANHILISKGMGLLVIPSDKVNEFKNLLIHYYEGKDIQSIKKFLKEQCYTSL